MKSFVKLPLYLGFFVFILSILVSAIKVGEQTAFSNQKTNASVSSASLSLKFTPPDLVSVILNSQKEVAGVDVLIRYEKDKVSISPSSLKNGSLFVTSGGQEDKSASTFLFSALASRQDVKSGIVATFQVLPIVNWPDITTELSIVKGKNKSGVIDKASGEDILETVSGVKFTLRNK